mmetsp:Transcript_1307/g.5065  ORF Transcript_1307/g.5065 Transcript_1307/m.5065 type:complete len:97 (+) Transcript_1307:465-755(+)
MTCARLFRRAYALPICSLNTSLEERAAPTAGKEAQCQALLEEHSSPPGCGSEKFPLWSSVRAERQLQTITKLKEDSPVTHGGEPILSGDRVHRWYC